MVVINNNFCFEDSRERSQEFNFELITNDSTGGAEYVYCCNSTNVMYFNVFQTKFIVPILRETTPLIDTDNSSNTQSISECITYNFNFETCKKFNCCKVFKNKSFNKHIDLNQLKEYKYLFEFLKEWKESYHPLIEDPENKKMRFDLQKAINTPINSISNINMIHLFDKMKFLDFFFDGKDVEVAGKTISMNVCEEGKYFCMDLLAKKVVCQAEIQVSLQPESAFPLAALMVFLCQKYEPVQKLLLAHLFKKCPYLVPYYAPHISGQSEEEHYRELGYQYDDKIETHHRFLKRMSGIVRFYAAIIHTPAIILNKPHPYGLKSAWLWLNRFLNLEPCSDISATVLVEFLEVAGFCLQNNNGKQFDNVMRKIADEFLPQIKSVTLAGCGGPLQRLESFIEVYFRQGSIPQPSGIIDMKFFDLKFM